jgi:hypothetical protein
MTRFEATTIAKIAYKDIKAAINKFQEDPDYVDIICHWDGCITVGEYFFHEHELRKREDDGM